MPTFQGANIQSAIELGLKQLGVAREQVSVEVVQQGKKGFFGLGGKNAIVNLTVLVGNDNADAVQPKTPTAKRRVPLPRRHPEGKQKRDDQTAMALLQSYLEDITRELELEVTVTSERRGDVIWYQLTTQQEGFLIGRHGRMINALQYLAQTLFNRHGRSKWSVMLNVGDYRQRREQQIIHQAQQAAREVVASGQTAALEPMPSFERKIAHQALSDNEHVTTNSTGQEPQRRVVVAPAKRY